MIDSADLIIAAGALGAVASALTCAVLTSARGVALLRMKPGDVLVVKSAQRMSEETARRLRAQVGHFVPGHQVMVLDGGLDLAVIGGVALGDPRWVERMRRTAAAGPIGAPPNQGSGGSRTKFGAPS